MKPDTDIELGEVYRDKISGFEGVVTTIGEHLTGCTRIGICPTGSESTDRCGSEEFFYEAQLVAVEEADGITGVDSVTETEADLGDYVVDNVTNFQGAVSTVAFKLYNCPRVAVTPLSEGTPSEEVERGWFDTPRIVVKEEGVLDGYDSLQDDGGIAETGAIGSGVESKTDLA